MFGEILLLKKWNIRDQIYSLPETNKKTDKIYETMGFKHNIMWRKAMIPERGETNEMSPAIAQA